MLQGKEIYNLAQTEDFIFIYYFLFFFFRYTYIIHIFFPPTSKTEGERKETKQCEKKNIQILLHEAINEMELLKINYLFGWLVGARLKFIKSYWPEGGLNGVKSTENMTEL